MTLLPMGLIDCFTNKQRNKAIIIIVVGEIDHLISRRFLGVGRDVQEDPLGLERVLHQDRLLADFAADYFRKFKIIFQRTLHNLGKKSDSIKKVIE
jgi:hypothetical protein